MSFTDKEIVKYGSEILRKPSLRVSKFDSKLRKLASRMFKIMYAANGVGLAAPQIGINQRILVIDVDYNSSRYEDSGIDEQGSQARANSAFASDSSSSSETGLVIINPVIVYREGEMDSYEGCLSFPDVFFNVKRAYKIAFKYQDLNGKEHRAEAEGDLFCRCVQHEIDHLNGKLFVDIALDQSLARSELDKHGFAGVRDAGGPIIVL